MKALRIVLPIVVAGAVVLAVLARLAARSDEEAYRQRRDALRLEMVERAVVARGAGGPAGVEEARAILRWWDEATGALRKRFPGPAARQDERQVPGARGERSRGAAAQDAATWSRYARECLTAVRGAYAPVASGVDQGLRLDVLSIRPGVHPDTHERAIRVDFAVWGAPRRLEQEAAPGEGRGALHVVVPLSFRQLAFRFVDAAGKTYGEMTGSGEPYLALKDPQRFSDELPPGIAFGTWWIDPFPREAVRVELSVGLQVQGTGPASLAPAFRFELPVAEEWKLRPGEAFRAEAREAPPEAPSGR